MSMQCGKIVEIRMSDEEIIKSEIVEALEKMSFGELCDVKQDMIRAKEQRIRKELNAIVFDECLPELRKITQQIIALELKADQPLNFSNGYGFDLSLHLNFSYDEMMKTSRPSGRDFCYRLGEGSE